MQLAGQKIKGYELHELVGEGGFGAVYRATQPAVAREVAIKVILPIYANHPDFIRRFESEAQLIARLEHFHIVTLYDFWRDHDGAYLVMRWLRGGSLRGLLKKGEVPPEHAARWLDQIASALALAHHYGVIHRDIKPDNILLDEGEPGKGTLPNAYLADFGIAKDLAAETNVTQDESLLGSPAYFSPELIRGEPLTPATDIYSLGVMLYEMLVGHHPFPKLSPTTLIMKHLKDPLPELQVTRPDLPDEFNHVIQRATDKDPLKRYQDALSVAADFRRALDFHRQTTTQDSYFDTRPIPVLEDAMTVATQNPYKGLRAFQEADAADFNGRDTLVERLLRRMIDEHHRRFLAVIGPSGSGKSSVVKAGLIPALRQGALPGSDHWFVVEMLPGANPLEELESALLRIAVNPPESLINQLREDRRGLLRTINRILPAEGELLLVIDQFEEVFTLAQNEAERTHFLESLYTAITDSQSRLRVIVTLRADFYDRPLLYAEFGDLLRRRTEVVLPLNAQELESAIKDPAERVGVKLEPSLVEAIVKDVSDQPGALPLLQYALTELFERREGRRLTLQAYKSIGGTLGALARRAEELYSHLDDRGKEIARQIFLRLVTPGEGTEDTRRRVLQSELTSVGGVAQAHTGVVNQIIDAFGKYRLLTFDSDPMTRTPTVEVAHEALIRQWGRLREWLTNAREDLRQQRRLSAAAAEWQHSKNDPSFLLRGARLEQLQAWAEETTLSLNKDELMFLRASISEREAAEELEKLRRAREEALEKRSRTQLQALVGLLAVATVIAVVLSIFAISQSQAAQQSELVAQQNAAEAQENAAEAQSLALASSAQLALSFNNTELALALATAAERFDLPLVQRALYETAYVAGVRLRMNGHGESLLGVAYSSDGLTALSASADHTLILWDMQTGQALRTFEGHTDWVRSVVFSDDGTRALSASVDGTLILWDVATGSMLEQLLGHTAPVNGAVFTPDGDGALSVSDDATLVRWDFASGAMVRRYSAGDGVALKAIAYVPRPDGMLAALVGDENGVLALWNVDAGTPIRSYGARGEGHGNTVWSVAVLPGDTRPDGVQLALSGSSDRTMILWNLNTGQVVNRFEGHTDWVWSVAFSPDGRNALSGSEDGKVILWDVESATPIRRFEGHNGKVYTVAFSPETDGRLYAISGASDSTLIQWDIGNGEVIGEFTGHTNWVNAVAFSPDGQLGLSASSDDTLNLWDLGGRRILRTLGADGEGHTDDIWTAAFSPDGRYVLSGSNDTSAILWDVATGDLVRRYEGHSDWINNLAFSPDGRTFMTASGDTTMILWDVESGAVIRRYEGHTDAVTDIAFSPDSRTAISTSYDGTLILWDVETAEILRTFGANGEGHTDIINTVAFSPDGRTVLSGSNDATLILWDVQTGAVLRRFREHTSPVLGLEISPDGLTALSASVDNSVIRWDMATGVAINRFEGHTASAVAVAYSPDGHFALSGGYDNRMMMWRIDSLEELLTWTFANRYVRELNCAERERYNMSLCTTDAEIFPTRTPYPTFAPTVLSTPPAALDLTLTTATSAPSITPTLTPPPTPTPTEIPQQAQIGDQRGIIPLGDREAWLFEGRAGQTLTISLTADRPANDFSLEERQSRDLLDALLIVIAPDGSVLAEADDIAEGLTDSRIENLVLPVDGVYIIEARSYGNEMSGSYTLTISDETP